MTAKHVTAAVAATLAAAMLAAAEPELPDAGNPDYIYCEDFESGHEKTGRLPEFTVTGQHGVREGAGYKSRFGYSNVLIENNGIPAYPEVRFPRHGGVLFIHYNLKCPSNFYLGRANHGYYVYNSQNKVGMVVMDHATDHPAWLDPEWDPHTINVLRGSGYHRIIRSFEGFEPKRRGQWHSHQVMIVPSQKDAKVGRIKVWIDGELANFCKTDTVPDFDTFWISNYWHSMEYVPKDTISNVFESFTAPPHPAFEIHLDNLIVSKKFIEFGPNQFQVERVRFSDLKPDSFTVSFDTTAAATEIGVEAQDCSSPRRAQPGRQTPWHGRLADAGPPGYFHSVKIENLRPDGKYRLCIRAVDADGREVRCEPIPFTTSAGAPPEFDFPGWKGEVYSGTGFQGTPVHVRNFNSLSYVSWSGHDADDLIDTSKSMCVRYTKRAKFKAGTYVFRVQGYDGVRVSVDGQVKVDSVHRTQGHNFRKDFRMTLREGEHTVVVQHTMWRTGSWEQKSSKYLAFKITPDDTEPPKLYAHAIYNTRFYKPDEPRYCGRWSEYVNLTLEFGETKEYGSSVEGHGRCPYVKLGRLEVGKTYHWRVSAVDLMGNTTVTPDATFTCGDTLAPQKILAMLERASDTQLRLRFRARGEDGRHGAAASYDIRWSTEPLSIHNWDRATKYENAPKPQKSRTQETITLDGFPRGKTYYVAVRAIDQAGQPGLLSNVVSDPPGPEVMDCDGDGYGVGSLEGPDPDDYDASVPVGQRQTRGAAAREESESS